MATTGKPVPCPDFDSAGYWEAARRREFALHRCRDCKTYIHPPRAYCHNCLSDNQEWARLSGKGTVYSFTAVHRAVIPGFEGEIPFVIASVEPVEAPGVRVLSNIVGCSPGEVCKVERAPTGDTLGVLHQDRRVSSAAQGSP